MLNLELGTSVSCKVIVDYGISHEGLPCARISVGLPTVINDSDLNPWLVCNSISLLGERLHSEWGEYDGDRDNLFRNKYELIQDMRDAELEKRVDKRVNQIISTLEEVVGTKKEWLQNKPPKQVRRITL